MAIENVNIPAHPDVIYYLTVQGWIALAGALFFMCLLGIILILRVGRRGIQTRDIPWMIMAGAVSAFLVFEAVFSLRKPSADIVLEGDRLQVGSDSVIIDGTTEVRLAGGSTPKLPADDVTGFTRMPGATRFPPFFSGGPNVNVKTGNLTVTFAPVIYGPSGYLGANANPAIDALLTRLASRADGAAKDWLTWQSRPATYQSGAPRATYDLATFHLIYGIACAVIFGFLGIVVVSVARRRTRSAPTAMGPAR